MSKTNPSGSWLDTSGKNTVEEERGAGGGGGVIVYNKTIFSHTVYSTRIRCRCL